MSLEIRELVIKATIVSEGSGNAGTESTTQGTGANASSEELINICVEKVMEIIKEKNGR